MARVEEYRNYIQEILKQHAAYMSSDKSVQSELIFDLERDHYQIVNAGWQNDYRIYGCVLHLDIQEGKIWIQHDGTEIGIANELVALGVPKEDIVLAFHAPYKRKYTGFAVE